MKLIKMLFRLVKGISPVWLLFLVGLFLLWDTPVVYPLRLFVVILHEISHCLAAWLTGGEVVEIEIYALRGGVAITRGGSRFVILSAGYMGSLFWGGVILLLSARTHWDKAISCLIGIVLLLVTVLFVRNWAGFGLCVLFSVVLFASGKYLKEQVNDPLLRVVGFTSCIYALLDIRREIIGFAGEGSDLQELGKLTRLPVGFWGVFWGGIAILATLVFLSWASVKEEPAEEEFPKEEFPGFE